MTDATPVEVAALPPLPDGAPAGCPFAPPPGMAVLRSESPLAKVALPDGTSAWLATSFELVREIIAHRDFSSSPASPGFPSWNLPGGLDLPLNLTQADPPVHTRMRRMVGGEFNIKRVEELRPEVGRITAERCAAIERMAQPVDLVAHFSTPIPAMVISSMFGVPQEEYDFFVHRIQLVLAHTDLDSAERQRAKLELLQYMLGLIAQKRNDPDEGLLSKLVHENPEVSDVDLVSYASSLILAGFATTGHMIELSALTLIQHPELAERIRQDRAVLPALVEELLRYHTVVRHSPRRAALADVTFGDYTIRTGEGVIASVQAANWDAAAFPHPEMIDPGRPRSPRHLAFGHGIHVCLGAFLAKLELEVVLEQFAVRYPRMKLAIPASEIPYRTTTHLHGCYALPVDLGLRIA